MYQAFQKWIAPISKQRKTVYGGQNFTKKFYNGMFGNKLEAPVIKAGKFELSCALDGWLATGDRLDVQGDFDRFHQITDDMQNNSNGLEPIRHWHVDNAGKLPDDDNYERGEKVYRLGPEEFEERYGSLRKMLDPYVGGEGMQPATAEDISDYERYLYAIDHLGLTSFDLVSLCEKLRPMVTDLGSIIDANMILGFAQPVEPNSYRILEIGSGYGRLTEVLSNILGGRCKYTLADSVPASLMFSYAYLKNVLPDANIGYHYNGDSIEDDYDIFIMPTWELMKTKAKWDVVVCVETLQEMSKHHVDTYMSFIERSTAVGALVYISGAWNYINKDAYQLSNEFETIWLANTPRSWSTVHPTHLLRRQDGDFGEVNRTMLEHFALRCG
ncbi:putative sugar O-methyltransferase [Roseovarius sp.]